MDDLIGEFITETSQSLAVLDQALGKLAQNPHDPDVLATIFRLVHTIKSTCGFLGLPRLESLAQAVEMILAHLQSGDVSLTRETGARMLEAIGRIKGLIAVLAESGEEPKGDDRDLLARLNQSGALSGSTKAMPVRPAPVAALFEEKKTHTPLPSALSYAPPALTTHAESAPEPQTGDTRELRAELGQMLGELVVLRNQLQHTARGRPDRALDKPLRQVSDLIARLRGRVLKKFAPGPEGDALFGILPVLLMQSAGRVFALAQPQVRELIRLGGDSHYQLDRIHQTTVLRLRDQLVPLVYLRELLQLGGTVPVDGHVILIQQDHMQVGLVVDHVHGTEETLVRPLARVLRALGLYAGTTILGDDSIIMVLDAKSLLQKFGARIAAPAMASALRENFLLFQAGRGMTKAVALTQVLRLEVIDAAQIESTGATSFVPYRDGTMKLTTLPGTALPATGTLKVIVAKSEGETIGLVVDMILDIEEAALSVKLAPGETHYRANIAGRTVEVIDIHRLPIDTELA